MRCEPAWQVRTVVFIIMLWLAMPSDAMKYGVAFKAHDHLLPSRTTLLLNDGDPLKGGREYSEVEYVVQFRNEADLYGDMCCVYNADSSLVVRVMVGGSLSHMSLVVNDRLYEGGLLAGDGGEYVISLGIDRDKRRVVLSSDMSESHRVEAAIPAEISDKSLDRFIVLFGQQDLIDTAPVNIRDIKWSTDGVVAAYWPLRTHTGDICHDTISGRRSLALNPHWLLDDHRRLRRVWYGEFPSPVQTTVDPDGRRMYIADDDRIVIVNLCDSTIKTVPVDGGKRSMRFSPEMFHDGRSLVTVDLERGCVARFDTLRHVWSGAESNPRESIYGNHSWGADSTTAYAFGGYGYNRFRADLFEIDLINDTIIKTDVDSLPCPRSYCSAAVVDGALYIFGGRGNESGLQELPSRYFFELYRYDVDLKKCELLWAMPMDSVDYTFVGSQRMVYERERDAFIVGTTRCGCQLVRIGREYPLIQPVTAPLNLDMSFRDLNMDVFDAGDRYYFLLNRELPDLSHEVSVYEVLAPLGPDESTDENPVPVVDNAGIRWGWMVVFAVVILAVIAGCVSRIVIWRGNKNADMPDSGATCEIAPMETSGHLPGIHLLGNFEVLSPDGTNLTSRCAGRTGLLLILLLLEKDKGVALRTLDETIWYDKEPNAARNNRNVYLKRLRTLMEPFGVDISVVNNRCHIIINEKYCDYYMILRQMDAKGNTAHAAMSCPPPLLNDISAPWLDSYKAEFSQRCISMLELSVSTGSPDQRLRMAECLLRHDPFSEQGIRAKCRALQDMHMPTLARNAYDAFCSQYRRCMGGDPDIDWKA